MFVLLLNPIESSMETMDDVAWAENRESLINYVNNLKAEYPYTEKDENGRSWYKTFKKGCVLENYNFPSNEDLANQILPIQSEEEVIEQYRHWLQEVKQNLVYIS